MGGRRIAFALVGLVLLAGAVRAPGLGAAPWDGDEILALIKASGSVWGPVVEQARRGPVTAGALGTLLDAPRGATVADVVSGVRDRDPKHGSLYFVLLNLWTGLFGAAKPAARALGVVISLASVPLVYALGRALGAGALASLGAAALVAISPAEVRMARLARPYGLLGVEILAATLLLIHALRGRRWGWPLYGLVCAAGLHTHMLFGMSMAGHGVALFVGREGRRALLGWALAYAAAAVAWTPVALAAVQATGQGMEWAQGDRPWFIEMARVGAHGLHGFATVPERPEIVRVAVGALGLAVVMVVLVGLRRLGDRRAFSMLAAGIVVPLVILFASDLATGFDRAGVPRYARAVFPFLTLAAAIVFADRASRLRRPVLWAGSVGLCALVSTLYPSFVGEPQLAARARQGGLAAAHAPLTVLDNWFGVHLAARRAAHLPPAQPVLLVGRGRVRIPPVDGQILAWALPPAVRAHLVEAGWRVEPTGEPQVFELTPGTVDP